MIILGVDPGINNTGWAVIRKSQKLEYIASGVIKTKAAESLGKRLAYICVELAQLLGEYMPQMAALEETFLNNNALSSLKLAHARGAIMAEIAKTGIELQEFAAKKVKKTITGHGAADKGQIIHMVNFLFPKAKITSHDEADALAIAYCCLAYL